MKYGEVIENGEYCHHLSLTALCFKMHKGRFSLPRSHRHWTQVVSLCDLTVGSDPISMTGNVMIIFL